MLDKIKFEDSFLKRFHRTGRLLYNLVQDYKEDNDEIKKILEEWQLDFVMEAIDAYEKDDITFVQDMYDYLTSHKYKDVKYDKEYMKEQICNIIDNNYNLIYRD